MADHVKNNHQMSNYQVIYQLIAIFILLTACQDNIVLPPQCIPGKVEACPCLGGLQGVQTCSKDGRQFLPCDCGQGLAQADKTSPQTINKRLVLNSSVASPSRQVTPFSPTKSKTSTSSPTATIFFAALTPRLWATLDKTLAFPM